MAERSNAAPEKKQVNLTPQAARLMQQYDLANYMLEGMLTQLQLDGDVFKQHPEGAKAFSAAIGHFNKHRALLAAAAERKLILATPGDVPPLPRQG